MREFSCELDKNVKALDEGDLGKTALLPLFGGRHVGIDR